MDNLFAQLCDRVLRVLPILQLTTPVRYVTQPCCSLRYNFYFGYLVICLWNVDQGTILTCSLHRTRSASKTIVPRHVKSGPDYSGATKDSIKYCFWFGNSLHGIRAPSKYAVPFGFCLDQICIKSAVKCPFFGFPLMFSPHCWIRS